MTAGTREEKITALKVLSGMFVVILSIILILAFGSSGSTKAPVVQQPPDMSKEIADEQMRLGEFNDYMKQIFLAERNPDYASSKSDLVSFAVDAHRIFHEAHAVRLRCFAAKIPDSVRDHVTAQGAVCEDATMRESFVMADAGGVGGSLSDPWQLSHVGKLNDLAESVRPQILNWSALVDSKSDAFESTRLEIERYAASVCDPNFPMDLARDIIESCEAYSGPSTYGHFKADINKAELYKGKANEAAEVTDWTGGFINLRHSEMILKDARVRAAHDAYSRSTNYRP
jgi:hypothetical protein